MLHYCIVNKLIHFVECLHSKFFPSLKMQNSLSNVTDDSKDIIEQLIDENGKVWLKEDYLKDWNGFIKSEENEDIITENESMGLFPKLESENNLKEQQIGRPGWNSNSINNENLQMENYSTEYMKIQKKERNGHISSKHSTHLKVKSREYHSGLQMYSDEMKQKKHKCRFCSYSSTWKNIIQNHIKAVHLKLKENKCQLCEFRTSQKINLQAHVNAVHLKLRKHKCQLCEYSSLQKKQLQTHINSVHLKLKEHKCHLCEFRTANKNYIQNHINAVHFKLKKFKCHLCNISCSQKHRLQTHIVSKHLKLKKPYMPVLRFPISPETSASESHELCPPECQCQFCDFKASLKNNLRHHIDAVHLKVNKH